MMSNMATPTRAKRRFGAFLRELRNAAGLTAETVADELKTSSNAITRTETGEVKPLWATVLTLLNRYGATTEQIAEAERRWEDADQEPPSVRLPTGAHRAYRKLVNAEREATRERVIASYVLPSLLQTEPYVRALLAAGHRLQDPKTRQDSLIDVRLKRQQRLRDDLDPLTLHALIDESVLHREVGGRPVLHQQLAHLLVVAELPNVTIQVIPFGAGAYGSMSGSCVIVDYPEPDPTSGVYLEYPAGGAWVDNDNDVHRFTTMFNDVVDLAYTPADTTNHIHDRMKQLAM
jgi:transcriptional regulator with XRE-family HTH domain